jgi:enolase-phosphatase E1
VAWLKAWHARGHALFVYSSGSVAAQKLLYGHSDAGDLTPLFSGYFDTTTGHKREVDSYRAIARSIDRAAEEVVSLSDVVAELDAARAAGMRTVWLVRDGDTPENASHPVARSFDDVEMLAFRAPALRAPRRVGGS